MAVRTMIVDDAVMYRKLLSDVAGEFGEVELVGVAPSGEIALKKMALSPVDLVFCDVHMPGMDGLQTLHAIRAGHPETMVVMVSGVSTRNAEITVRALQDGALDFIRKPRAGSPEESREELRRDVAAVLRLAAMRMNVRGIAGRRTASACVPAPSPATVPGVSPRLPASRVIPRSFAVVAIGVSTGGPEALNILLPGLPASLPVPIVLVQHMPPKFTASLAESLDKRCLLRVVEGADGEVLRPGTVSIAPGGRHMVLRQGDKGVVVGLNDGPLENSCRPSVDVLFRSVGAVYGDRGVLACVLTGMGADGLQGVRALRRKACYCVTQSAATCVVYGMPRAVDEAGLSDLSLPLAEIAGEIRKRLG